MAGIGELIEPPRVELTEKEYQAQIVELAETLGWRIYHTHDSRRSPAGFPDLVAAHPIGGVIFVEVKARRGRLSQAQRAWLDCLWNADARVFVWRDGVTSWEDEVVKTLDVERRLRA